MKTRIITQTCLLAGITVINLALLPTLQAQTTTSTTANPTGSEADSKSSTSSTAQLNDASTGTATTPATAPDKTNSKDTADSLDKNPSTASSDSADKSATKDTTTATMEDRTSDTPASGHFSDKHFLVKAAEGGLTEVQLGQIAQQNASSEEVKQFGARMVADHSKANDELKGIAQQKGVSVPTKLDVHHQAMVDRLSKLSGPEFDRAYVNDMVEDHKKDVAEFQKASTSAQDPDVKAFAGKTLPVIQSHLADIQNIQSNLK